MAVEDEYYDDMTVEPSERVLTIVATEKPMAGTPRPNEPQTADRPQTDGAETRELPPGWNVHDQSNNEPTEFDILLEKSADYQQWLQLKDEFLRKERHLLYGTDIPVSTDYQVI